MLSRLLATTGSRIAARNQPPQSRIAAAAASTTADPALYSGEHKPGPDVDYPEPHGAKSSEDTRKFSDDRKTDPFTKPKSPLASSARVESAGVRNPAGESSNFQQKRKASTAGELESVSCVGFDGTLGTEKREDQVKDDEESNKEYFRHHKASPLSEIKIADTRKPITRASDETAAGGSEYGGGTEVIGWRAEQVESAEETMRKAMENWKQNAMRGDPETFPHSRVLRELRGEWF